MATTFPMQPWTTRRGGAATTFNMVQPRTLERFIRYQIVPGAVSGNWTMTFKICASVR